MRLHKLPRLQGESAHCSGTRSPGDWGGWRSRGGRICLRYAPRSRLRTYLGLRGTHQVLSRAPWRWASAAAPDGAHPAVLRWGSAPSPPGCARGGALSAGRWPGCGLEERKVARPGGGRAGAAGLASGGGSEAPRSSASLQPHRRPPSRRLPPLGWGLESWEGLAPSLGPLEAGAWLKD